MHGRRFNSVAVAILLSVALSAGSADAQARGKEKQKDDRDRVEEGVLGDIFGRDVQARGNGAEKVPPGWCRGQGNPHRTVANCGAQAAGVYDDDRYPASRDRYPISAGDSYVRQHEDFHRYLDDKYARLAAQRRTDVAYQLRLRADKSAEHNRWHDGSGTRH